MTTRRQKKSDKMNGLGGHLPVQMLGIPTDRNSSYRWGTRLAPENVRKVFSGGMSNLTAENG